MATLPKSTNGQASGLSAYNQRALAKNPGLASAYGVTSGGMTAQNSLTKPASSGSSNSQYGPTADLMAQQEKALKNIPDTYAPELKTLNSELPQIQQRYASLLQNLNDQVTTQLKGSLGQSKAQAAAAGVASAQGTPEMAAQQNITNQSNQYLAQQQNVLASNESSEENQIQNSIASIISQQAAAQQSAQQQIAQIGEAGIQYQQNQDLAEKQATVQQQQFDEQMAMYKAQTASGGGTAAGSITVPGTGATIDKSQVTTLNSLTTKASADITNIFNNPKLNEADLRQSWANSWNKIRAIFPVTVMSNEDIDNYLGVNGGWATLQSQYRNKYSSSTSSSSADKFDPNKTN